MRTGRAGATGLWMAGVLCRGAEGRAPLVSLTVSIVSNGTGGAGAAQQQATFDRSDYAYPVGQTGVDAFGFAGELYVPEAATCADDMVGQGVRAAGAPEHLGGIVFLPFRSCRGDWEQLVAAEAASGRAVGALLYSLKDDAAQAAELTVVVDSDRLNAPVWMVNAVVGEYLTAVLQHVHRAHAAAAATASAAAAELPRPPASAAVHGSAQTATSVGAAATASVAAHPRVLVSISRSATDVATQDRNFFLKAMVGVGITGIVCFFIAILVRYFDCIGSRRARHQGQDQQPEERRQRRGRHRRQFLPFHGGGDGGGSASPATDSARQLPRAGEKRVLQRTELDRMPCTVVGRDWRPPPAAHVSWRAVSCPHLPTPRAAEAPAAHRAHSTQDTSEPRADAASGWSSDGHECAICLDDIGVGDVVRNLPCPHRFHAACIDRWLLCQSSVCPLCKRDTIHA